MRPAATFVTYVYTIKITQNFRRLGISLTVICLHVRLANKPTE
jgi:hypothetical protein